MSRPAREIFSRATSRIRASISRPVTPLAAPRARRPAPGGDPRRLHESRFEGGLAHGPADEGVVNGRQPLAVERGDEVAPPAHEVLTPKRRRATSPLHREAKRDQVAVLHLISATLH